MSQPPENPYASPTTEIFPADETPDPPGEGPFAWQDDWQGAWVGGPTPLSLPSICLACGDDSANNERRVKQYRHHDRKRYPIGCKVSYSVCRECGGWIDFWRRCERVSAVCLGLSILAIGVGLARFYATGQFDPQNLALLYFAIVSIPTVGIFFFGAVLPDSFQPLRLKAVRDVGDQTFIICPSDKFRQIVQKFSSNNDARAQKETG